MTHYRVDINYQTASGGNTARLKVEARDHEEAYVLAAKHVKLDKRRRVMKIDGGDVMEDIHGGNQK